MAGSSSSDHHLHIVDDFYFSALHDVDEIFPISDEKYAEELQLQEALMSSSSLASLPSHNPSSSSSSSSSPKQQPQPLPMEEEEEDDKFCEIRMDRKSASASDVFHNINVCSHLFCLDQPLPMEEEEEEDDKFCEICMERKSASDMFHNINVCSHLFCLDCIRSHVAAKIKDDIIQVNCPRPKCNALIGPEICRPILPKQVLERWEDSLCESLILGSQKFYCPFKDCSAMLVDDGGETVTSSECPNCNRLFCAQCKVVWHSGMDCREFQSLNKGERDPEDIMLMELANNKKWRRCPHCNFYVEKRDGCLHISCRCGNHFCYGCGNKHTESHVCPST